MPETTAQQEWRYIRASELPGYSKKTGPPDKIVGFIGTFVTPRDGKTRSIDRPLPPFFNVRMVDFLRARDQMAPDLETIAEAARRFKTIPKTKPQPSSP